MLIHYAITGGGLDMLTVGFKLSEQSEAVAGILGNLNIWNYQISSNEVKSMSYGCDRKEGNLLSWTSILNSDKTRMNKTNIRTPATCKYMKGNFN
jgi:hypothetical protein